MSQSSFLETLTGHSLEAFTALSSEQRASAVRKSVVDLHGFLDDGVAPGERDAPGRTRMLAQSLFEDLSAREHATARLDDASLPHRIVTDALLRREADRDQNVYLGRFFTRRLTNAVPDLIFQPVDLAEASAALGWARANHVPVTWRGAASTAMGGAVPCDGGLTLDVSRLDMIDPEVADGIVVIGAGARLRDVHAKLAALGYALEVYPSNLGGTFAGWFATGGIGMNAYSNGHALHHVKSADVLLASGDSVRFHSDGRLDVRDASSHRHTIDPDASAAWFRERGLEPLTLADMAGSEGVFGLILALAVAIEPLPEIGAFLLAFERRADALSAVQWIASAVGEGVPTPANIKLLSGSHMHHVRRVWKDEEAREWRAAPGALSSGVGMPWSRVEAPAVAGIPEALPDTNAAAYLFVDFLSLDEADAFASLLDECPGGPSLCAAEGARFAAERFKPQQSKRLGPGLLAAEIVLPAAEIEAFLPEAERMARQVGLELDTEIYYLSDGSALAIAAYLTDHRRGGFPFDLLLAPALLDLAMTRHHGRPYVLGRWQASWTRERFGATGAARLAGIKLVVDPDAIVNRGVLFGLRLRGLLGTIVGRTFGSAVRVARIAYSNPLLAGLVRMTRGLSSLFGGPAGGRGEPAHVGATFRASPPVADIPGAGAEWNHAVAAVAVAGDSAAGIANTPQRASARALHCVNCGECNSVCPIFYESKIRLPQMLTHIGEAMHGGVPIDASGSALLDLCIRCGNCEEVCQAGIPHLPLYEVMQHASDRTRSRDVAQSQAAADGRERHVAILAALRGSNSYMRDFLGVRPGGYLKRAPAALPGLARYVLLRAENDAGPAASCIHCGACVDVCPTAANSEFEHADPRLITTDSLRCIGCGTCVEVCPANHLNGGQTLRVMEAPTRDWWVALEAFEKHEADRVSSSPH